MPPVVPGHQRADALHALRADGCTVTEDRTHTHARPQVKQQCPCTRHPGKDILPNTIGNMIVQAGCTSE